MREPWNAAGNLWHRARNAVAPRKRVVPKPIEGQRAHPMHFAYPLMKGQQCVEQDGKLVDCVCRDCGCTICGCDQLFEMRQEAQRAALAPTAEEMQRQGYAPRPRMRTREEIDRARMSLGYGERDYDQARRVNIAEMQRELSGLQCMAQDIARQMIADGVPGNTSFEQHQPALMERIRTLQIAIDMHKAKLPRTPGSQQLGNVFKQVGSTDIKLTPGNAAFFFTHDGLYKQELSAPYRSVMITGIKATDPADKLCPHCSMLRIPVEQDICEPCVKAKAEQEKWLSRKLLEKQVAKMMGPG